MSQQAPLILASSSPYRADLLRRIIKHFEQHSPQIDEGLRPEEDPIAACQRLAQEKAEVVAGQQPGSWVIASDQIGICRGQILGKPLTRERAIEQLLFCQGQSAVFHTSICLYQGERSVCHLDQVPTELQFRTLSQAAIEDYVDSEAVLNCAGSFKVESLGIRLFERVSSEDPNALIGLPLIRLTDFLEREGLLPEPL